MIAFLYASCCLIWGSTWLAIKLGLEGVPPMLGAGLRFLLAAAILWALVLARGAKRLTRDDKISIASAGLLSFTISYACAYMAEVYISSALTALLFSTMPLVVAVLSRFWMRSETLGPRKAAGILLGLSGAAVLFWPQEGVASASKLGMGFALASAASAGVNMVILKKHSKHGDIFVLNAGGMTVGACGLLLLHLLTERGVAVTWSAANVGAIVYLAVLGSVAAFLAYFRLIKELQATTLSFITLIFPIVAVILGAVFLGERLSAQTALGAGIILGGVGTAIVPAGWVRRKAAAPPVPAGDAPSA